MLNDGAPASSQRRRQRWKFVFLDSSAVDLSKLPRACEHLATKKAMWFKRLDASIEYISNKPIVT